MAFRVLVRESVDDVFIRIDLVRDLNKTRSPRVHEERRAGDILKHAPLRADFSELTARFPR